MNLRLPGQVYDAVTGLHQNYMREYDPELGRYTTPDPTGLAGGINPYIYVGNNPLTNIDPLGLYQIDVHYYITYFLAIKAGLATEDALQIALAAQYVDDNPYTSPMPLGGGNKVVLNVLENQQALLYYHFVLSESDRKSSSYGETIGGYANTNVLSAGNALSPQLENLFKASQKAPVCGRNQMFGEFLHSFEDTYSHRTYDNWPVDALSHFDSGLGHGADLTYPDMTFNPGWRATPKWPFVKNWENNEGRTLAMELAMFKKVQEYAGTTTNEVDMSKLIGVLEAFNKTEEDEDGNVGLNLGGLFAGAGKTASGPSTDSPSNKLKILNKALGKGNEIPYYSVLAGCKNRQIATSDMFAPNYEVTILTTLKNCPTIRPH